MTDPFPATPSPTNPLPRARSGAWRLSLLVPALLLLAYGGWFYTHPPAGGTVHSVRAMPRSDLAGQVRDAYDGIEPGTPDLYLVLRTRGGNEITTKVFDNTPLGNGLTWDVPNGPVPMPDLTQVSVWDRNALLKDKQLDRIELDGTWAATGQTYRIELLGTRPLPPDWSLPVAAVGATLLLVVLIRFVWDQAF